MSIPGYFMQTSAGNDDDRVRIAAVVTLFSARHLPHSDGMFGTCDAFIEVVYKDKTLKSTVRKNSLDPDWKPEEKFEFDLSSGELADIQIQLKDWNMTTSAKLLGTTVIAVDALKRLLAGDKAAFPSDEFLITAPDGTPLLGKGQQQAHLVLKVGVVVDKDAAEKAEKAAAETAVADAKVVILKRITQYLYVCSKITLCRREMKTQHWNLLCMQYVLEPQKLASLRSKKISRASCKILHPSESDIVTVWLYLFPIMNGYFFWPAWVSPSTYFS
jgi:hypothetical protein